MSGNEKGEYTLEQQRYWGHTIKDDRDLSAHMDYIHYNPVNLAWSHSTFHRYVRKGMLPPRWSDSVTLQKAEAGHGEWPGICLARAGRKTSRDVARMQ